MDKNPNPFRWRYGVLGTGSIANKFALAIQDAADSRLSAVASRSQQNAVAFAEKYDAEHAHGRYEDLLTNRNVDIVYVATPNHLHCEWAIKAMEAGKHVLCEKPLGMNAAEAAAMIDASKKHERVLMEGFMYRGHPQTLAVLELLTENRIGDVRIIEAQFGIDFGTPESNPNVRWRNAFGGGAIVDLGCYCLTFASMIAGKGHMVEPEKFEAVGTIGSDTGVDEWSIATMLFPGGVGAVCKCAMKVRMKPEVVITGSEARIRVPSPFAPDGFITVETLEGDIMEEIELDSVVHPFTHQINQMSIFAEAGTVEPPWQTPAESLLTASLLDRWREAIGLEWESEIA